MSFTDENGQLQKDGPISIKHKGLKQPMAQQVDPIAPKFYFPAETIISQEAVLGTPSSSRQSLHQIMPQLECDRVREYNQRSHKRQKRTFRMKAESKTNNESHIGLSITNL